MEAFILGDPTNISLITIIIGIPLYQLVFIRWCSLVKGNRQNHYLCNNDQRQDLQESSGSPKSYCIMLLNHIK